MKDKTKIDHFRENKSELDYILVYDKTLKGEKIKPLKDIKLFETNSLINEYDKIYNELNETKKHLKALEQDLKETKELLSSVVRGLNSRWKK